MSHPHLHARPWNLLPAATEVVLIPIDAELTVPDLRWIVAGLLSMLYLAIGWRRAARAALR